MRGLGHRGGKRVMTTTPTQLLNTDTKGNNGIRGLIRITNLRVLWETKKHENLNLSIGHKTILNCQTKHVSSKLRGNIEALHILAKGKSSRFEVIIY